MTQQEKNIILKRFEFENKSEVEVPHGLDWYSELIYSAIDNKCFDEKNWKFKEVNDKFIKELNKAIEEAEKELKIKKEKLKEILIKL